MTEINVTLTLDEVVELAVSKHCTSLNKRLEELSNLNSSADAELEKAEDALTAACEKLLMSEYGQHVEQMESSFGKENVQVEFVIDGPSSFMTIAVRSYKVDGHLDLFLDIGEDKLKSMPEYKAVLLAEEKFSELFKEEGEIGSQLQKIQGRTVEIKNKLASHVINRQIIDLFEMAKSLLESD